MTFSIILKKIVRIAVTTVLSAVFIGKFEEFLLPILPEGSHSLFKVCLPHPDIAKCNLVLHKLCVAP